MAHWLNLCSMISGGADPSVHLWDLESRGSELEYLHQSIASVDKLVTCSGEEIIDILTVLDHPMNRHIHML